MLLFSKILSFNTIVGHADKVRQTIDECQVSPILAVTCRILGFPIFYLEVLLKSGTLWVPSEQ
jgi:hypothetical protein